MSNAESAKIGFESAIARLEIIVKELERGELPLDQALALFQEGTSLVGQCSLLLDEAELTVSRLIRGASGEPIEKEFDGNGTV